MGAAYGALIKIYQGAGFRYEHAFTRSSYREFLEGMALGPVAVEVVDGKVPEGIGILEKPAF